MNNWIEHLASLGARFNQADSQLNDATQVEDFGKTLSAADLAAGVVAPVTDLGLIAVSGDDAASFLHSQLTNDVEHLGPNEARLAGYCTPKGRLQATFLMWRSADGIYMQLPRAIQAPLQKRLSMFVLRAKAKLRDATEEAATAAVLGLAGGAAAEALRRHVDTLPSTPYATISGGFGTVIRLADAFGAPRYLWITSAESAIAALPQLRKTLALGGNAAWHLADIHAGVPQVTQPTQEQFVPQMVNFELIGGVNFKKGCYPGQEIVARTQYRGILKRRMALAHVPGDPPAPGQKVYSSAFGDQAAGEVVNAAPAPDGGADLLVVAQIESLRRGDLRLGSPDGTPIDIRRHPAEASAS
jgi:folate-binding protein YgfZ